MAEYLIREEQVKQLADIVRDVMADIDLVSDRENFNVSKLPEGITSIGNNTFYNCSNLSLTSLPEGITSIGTYAFYSCTKLTTLTFKGTPTSIVSNAFMYCNSLTTINVPWAEGAVANAPWGATKATINYNYTEEA